MGKSIKISDLREEFNKMVDKHAENDVSWVGQVEDHWDFLVSKLKQILEGLSCEEKEELYRLRRLDGSVLITESREEFDREIGDGGSCQEVYNKAMRKIKQYRDKWLSRLDK